MTREDREVVQAFINHALLALGVSNTGRGAVSAYRVKFDGRDEVLARVHKHVDPARFVDELRTRLAEKTDYKVELRRSLPYAHIRVTKP